MKELKIISRKEAKEQGLKRYFTGKPCKHGHISERYIGGSCVECMRLTRLINKKEKQEYDAQYNESNEAKIKQRRSFYYKTNKKKIQQYRIDNAKKIQKQRRDYYVANKIQLTEKTKQQRQTFANYNTYYSQLIPYGIACRRSKNIYLLEVRCMYCNQWHTPTNVAVQGKIRAIHGHVSGELNFYCSGNCKKACPTYNQAKYPKGFKQDTSREVQAALRKLVLERDGWACVKCKSTEQGLHCHHIQGVELNPVESADMDNCITVCKECHNDIHKTQGCRYSDYRRRKCFRTT